MCGIAGILHFNSERSVNGRLLDDMTDILRHRGPDGRGTFTDGNIGLGHRRLAIIDLHTGQQPMASGDRKIWIVVNGEIYNYLDLKAILSSKGHRFQTGSDSEVIIHAYREWGTDCVKKFNGMFAFALWDCSRKRLILARDRLGIKPLYTTVVDGTLLFASEIKSLLTCPGVERRVDPEAISSYLGYRHVLGEGTLFRGINKLKPGHLLISENGYLSSVQYWDVPVYTEREDRGEEYYTSRVREMLKESVKRRMMSNVPLGAYLSGGLDSSIVVALLSEMSDDPVKTYTVAFPQEDFSERRYASMVASGCETDHTEVMIDDSSYMDMIPRLIRFKDAPLAVANEVPLHLMSRELKKDITVVLSGEGADELFGGYGRIFRSPFDYQRSRFLENHRHLLPEYRNILMDKFSDIYGSSVFLNETDHFMRKYHYLSPLDRETFLTPGMLDQTEGDSYIREHFEKQFREAEGLSHYHKILYIFQKTHLQNLLMRVDMTTMATSVEARVPFVDHQLVEFVLSIPFHYKVRWKSEMHRQMAALLSSDELSENYDTTKYILKRAFRDDLPRQIIDRRKMGFPVPLNRWLGGNYMSRAKEILLDRRTASRGIIDVSAVEKELASQRIKEHSTALKMWMLMNLEIWFREYIDQWEGGKVPEEETSSKEAPTHRTVQI